MNQPKEFARPAAEDWLAWRLEQLGHALEPGAGTLKERLRDTITARGIGCIIAGRAPGGRPETFEEAFARIFGEPLVRIAPRETRSRSTQRKVVT